MKKKRRKKMIIIKTNRDKVRHTCIEQNWYTGGTCEQYENLLYNMCDFRVSQTEETIKAIATDIFEHSSNFGPEYTDEEHINNIAFYILNDCCTYFMN